MTVVDNELRVRSHKTVREFKTCLLDLLDKAQIRSGNCGFLSPSLKDPASSKGGSLGAGQKCQLAGKNADDRLELVVSIGIAGVLN
ncbi:hypothetical protein Aduo_011633 [Ancylostoma duodenale]